CISSCLLFILKVLLPCSLCFGSLPLWLTTTTEKNEIVNKHNTLRGNVQPTASNMLKMVKLRTTAQRWANTCSMKHSPASDRVISTSGCGENLYMSSFQNTWSNAIQSWYDEVKDFSYGVGSINGGVVGHYTQVVWYRSNQIGCAMAYCPNSAYKYFYVCHYCPPYLINKANLKLLSPHQLNAYYVLYAFLSLAANPCPFSDKYSNCPQLKQQWGCNNPTVASWCPASCKCTNQII
uniref:Cysteine rich secretory protein 2 n=1 Tax=Maylandia zebra TaxID=106582 RepID=A0A3P9DTI4_9CICH